MFGAIVGSTSPAVIVPLTRGMKMEQSSETILFLESALSDVLSIVVAIGFMDSYKLGTLHVGQMIGHVLATLILAGLAGLGSAFLWPALAAMSRRSFSAQCSVIRNAIFWAKLCFC